MSDLIELQPYLKTLSQGATLSEQDAYEAFEIMMTGRATGAQIGALLAAMQVRAGGPAVSEITGAARVMREHATAVTVPDGMTVIDTCGTGGDHAGTFNVSTAAAIVAAGAGAHVAKHGNRSVTSKSGSSQVLEALGVKLDVDGDTLTRCLESARICFCFAPAHHPAMKHAIGPRKELGFRTLFNVLGPLTNPAGARRQVMGVFDPGLTEPIAEVLASLGSEHAMVVHGSGLDEIGLHDTTRISTAHNGSVTTTTFNPADIGVDVTPLDELKVDSVERSAAVIRDVLGGQKGPARDIVCLNAGAALVVAGQAEDLKDGFVQSGAAIDDAKALGALNQLVAVTNGYEG